MDSALPAIQSKIMSGVTLDRWLAHERFMKHSLVFTNGCFDVLHRGHILYLIQAASMGDRLIIGLNTDASVKKLKGPSRPLLDEQTRALILASLSFVSAVLLFNEETPFELIQKVCPDILVKGGDYQVQNIVGYDIVTANGGKVLTVPLVEGFSSTAVINKTIAC
jgi:rfaE bifunctional protein nucleotidyltransferase chain/domain